MEHNDATRHRAQVRRAQESAAWKQRERQRRVEARTGKVKPDPFDQIIQTEIEQAWEQRRARSRA